MVLGVLGPEEQTILPSGQQLANLEVSQGLTGQLVHPFRRQDHRPARHWRHGALGGGELFKQGGRQRRGGLEGNLRVADAHHVARLEGDGLGHALGVDKGAELAAQVEDLDLTVFHEELAVDAGDGLVGQPGVGAAGPADDQRRGRGQRKFPALVGSGGNAERWRRWSHRWSRGLEAARVAGSRIGSLQDRKRTGRGLQEIPG